MYKWLTSLVVCLLTITQQSYADSAILDGFDGLEGWSVATPDGVALEIAQDEGRSGSGMRLDFDFHGGGGYLVARKKLTVPLPANYAFSFYVRGEAPDNDLEFKLLDSSEKEIWWAKRREFSFPAEWQKITVKKRHLEFAWGPSGGEELKEVAVVEFAITAGNGGKGSVWIDDLVFEQRPISEYTATPLVKASTTENGYEPAKVFDKESSAGWRSGSIADEQWLLIDFQQNSEYGGLIIDWQQDDYAKAYDVQISDDGENWQRVFSVEDNNGGRDYVYLPDLESRFIRLDLKRSSRGRGYGVAAIEVKPYQFSSSPNNLFTAVAADSPRGDYPRYLTGEQAYWTVVGVSGDEKEALLNQDGLLEVDKEHFSIEPFLYIDEGLIGWNDVTLTHELENQYLPIPSVIWERAGLKLRITALAADQAGNSSLYAKYRVENHTKQRQQGTLFLALRPFQVNPPWQSLNMDGGAASIREMFYDDNTVFVDNGKALTSLSTAERFGAVTFAQGSIMGYLHKGHLPLQTDVVDSFGYASGALEYSFDLPPGGAKSFYITVPFHQSQPLVEASLSEDQTQQLWHTAFEATKQYWESKLSSVDVQLPRSADKLVKTLKSTVAYILINQDGPAIQPGSRAYDRSWIRDGALTAAALLRMGHTKEVREFIEWYGKFQWPNGKIPCCVDWRGRDPIEEHDSHGQWIYLVMEYYRFTRDVGFLTEMWPRIDSAINYIVWLRQQRLTDEYKTPEKLIFYGLVPESVSHEGYMDAPVHSYWDDLFVLRGLKDATNGAVILGEKEAAQRFSSLRDTFRNDLMTSMERSMALHRVNYIPGAAELGDFDSNATTIGLDPVGETSALPQEALHSTFDKYYEILSERINEDKDWRVYTPYELRAVGALIRMGHKDRAHEALEFFFEGQHPQAWNHWAEVVWRDPKTPRYIGDMPHTWVGSDYIRSIRSLFVYERESDHALIIGEGVLADWVISDQGLSIKRLPTHYGTLNYSMRMSENGLSVSLSGDVNIPPGKIVIRSPLNAPLSGVTVNGKPIKSFKKDEVIVDQFPAEIMLHYKSSSRTAQTAQDSRRSDEPCVNSC